MYLPFHNVTTPNVTSVTRLVAFQRNLHGIIHEIDKKMYYRTGRTGRSQSLPVQGVGACDGTPTGLSVGSPRIVGYMLGSTDGIKDGFAGVVGPLDDEIVVGFPVIVGEPVSEGDPVGILL